MDKDRIISNKIRCGRCDQVIESTSVHDFKACECGAVSSDGSLYYLRRKRVPEDWGELSEVVKKE